MCFDADVFNPLTSTDCEEAERESSIKDICSSLKESFVNDKILEMTENEFIHYQSHMIGHVETVTIEEARSSLPRLVVLRVFALTGLDPNENVSTWCFFPFYPHFLHEGKNEFMGGIFV